jgi:disulfide bond formation protein DsbB
MIPRLRRILGPFSVFAAELEILVLCGVLAGAFWFQFLEHEMPCPLCVLQRLFMMLAAVGAAWIVVNAQDEKNAFEHFATGHGMIILSALCGSFVSIRQILLHIVPPDPGYGGTQLGLHLYTWALIVFICLIASSGVSLLFARFFLEGAPRASYLPKAVLGLLGAMILANTVSITLELGFHEKLPDDPSGYQLIDDLRDR